MNIATVETFLAVVQAGNLNRAAEQLNVTQSTVTARLDSLEDLLGQDLLIRSRRGAQLTRAGFAFQRHAELMLQSWEQARKSVGLPKGFSGLFGFACHSDLWESGGADWLEKVRATQPGLAIEVWQGGPDEIQRWLAAGLVDAALAPEPIVAPGVGVRDVKAERLVQVATVQRPVQAWDEHYVYVDLGPGFRRQHSQAWPIDETAGMTFSSSRWALDHLLAHGGSAYLPWRLAEAPVADERLFVVEGAPEFTRPRVLVWREASLAAHPWLQAAIDGF